MTPPLATPRLPRALLALILAAAAAGCHRDPAQRAAEEIVEKNVAARGGLAPWRDVKTLALSGKLDAGTPRDPVKLAMAYQRQARMNKVEARRAAEAAAKLATLSTEPPRQVQLPYRLELERPRRSRLEVDFQGQTAVQVYDGTGGWKVRPYLGRRDVEPFTREELRIASEQTELDGLLIDHAAKGLTVKLVGNEQVDGKDAYKLEVTGEGQTRHVWVDAHTFLDVRVDGTRRVDGKQRTVWTTYRDFRSVNGLLFPHQLETTVEGIRGSERILVEKVSVNPKLPDARFERPE